MSKLTVNLLGIALTIALFVGFGLLAVNMSKKNWNGNVCTHCHTENAYEFADSNRNCYVYKCKNCGHTINIWMNNIEDLK